MTTKSLRTEPQKRLHSLDALRGFDMFWITGGSALVVAISQFTGPNWLETQMHHVSWEGFRFYDLIFPLFMFISGVAIPLSVTSKIENNVPRQKLFLKALKRGVLLILLGILYNGTFRNGFENGRIASVLGQIGIAYFLAAIIVIYTKSVRSRLIWFAGILTGIGIIQLLIPVPGIGAGVLTPEGCINGYIDRMLLPGRLNNTIYDPEGILCSISATGITLMGTFAGSILRSQKSTDWQKIGYLLAAGAAAVVLALAFSTFYPIIKKCWTSTFNLLTGGISFMLLAFFYMIIDHFGYRKWAFFFTVIGMNSIFIYLFSRMGDPGRIGEFFVGWLANMMSESGGNIVLVIGRIAVSWSILYYMYKKKIFLRI